MATGTKWQETGRGDRPMASALAPLREVAFSVLSLAAPIVSFVFGAAGIIGLLTCLGFYVGPPHTHFPMALMLGISLGSFVIAALYSSLVHALDPEA
jgi:hypothetical protein